MKPKITARVTNVTRVFLCQSCGGAIPTTWPSGDPVVGLYAQRCFHVEQANRTHTTEPAGHAQLLICLKCDIRLWAAIRAALQPAVPAARKDETEAQP